MGKPDAGSDARRWSKEVGRRSQALHLEAGVFTWQDPQRIAASLLQSAQDSRRRRRSAYGSAMAMLCFFINRAGRNLPAERLQVLSEAKRELRRLGREDDRFASQQS